MTAQPAARTPEHRPKVVFYDPPRPGWAFDIERSVFAPHGVELIIPVDDAEGDTVIEDADVVIVAGVRRMGAAQIQRLRRAVGLQCYSVGMNQVDAAAAAKAGIPVRNVPGYSADEVADHALTLLLAAWRRLVPLVGKAASEGWPAAQASPESASIRRIRGKTLGVLGAGRIGAKVAARARAFGMRTIAADPYGHGTDELPILPLAEVLTRADGLVCCAALTPESRGVLGAEMLALVKPGLIFVNVARGGLVDEAALAAALQDGRIASAALDVREPEPPDPARDLLSGLPNVIQTPHVGGLSQEAYLDLHREAAESCLQLLRSAGRLPPAQGA